MWIYEKKLQYPVHIKNPNPALAKLIMSQYGGPHGELGASLRYLSQRYTMSYPELRAILTDIGISVSEMLQCPCSKDKQLSFGLKIHSLTEFKSAKKRCDSDNVKQSNNPDFIEDMRSKRIINLYAVASV